MKFEGALAVILPIETGGRKDGGYTDDPRDPGGETKWGISKRAFPHLDISRLTFMEASVIYRVNYWDAAKCDDVHPPYARLAVFDCAVNQGVGVATGLWEQARGSGEALPIMLALRALRYARSVNFARYGKGWMKRLFLIAIESGKLMPKG